MDFPQIPPKSTSGPGFDPAQGVKYGIEHTTPFRGCNSHFFTKTYGNLVGLFFSYSRKEEPCDEHKPIGLFLCPARTSVKLSYFGHSTQSALETFHYLDCSSNSTAPLSALGGSP